MPDTETTTTTPPTDSPASGRDQAGVAVVPHQRPAKTPPRLLPPYKVMLHNDDVNEIDHVIRAILKLTPLGPEDAVQRTLEAHKSGVALLLVTHKERAELYVDQFASLSLTVTIEQDS